VPLFGPVIENFIDSLVHNAAAGVRYLQAGIACILCLPVEGITVYSRNICLRNRFGGQSDRSLLRADGLPGIGNEVFSDDRLPRRLSENSNIFSDRGKLEKITGGIYLIFRG
jgi:hypothetical protein